MNKNYLNELIEKVREQHKISIETPDINFLENLIKLKNHLKQKNFNATIGMINTLKQKKLTEGVHESLLELINYYKNNPDEAYHDDESTEDNPAEVVNQLPTNVKDRGIQQQADNQSQEESKTVESKDSEKQQQEPPTPNQPPPQLTQFELGIALGALQKETVSLKEYLDNVVAKQKDLNRLVCDEKEMFININNNAGILSETMNRIEPLILEIMPKINKVGTETSEKFIAALSSTDLLKKVTEYQIEVDAMLKKIRDTTNADIDDLYKVVRKSAGTIIDETLGQSQKTIVDSAIKVVETATAKTDKKYTNLIMFGLVGAFACSLLTSAFTAKLVATYSSNNTIEYITKLLNAASDKNKEQQQIKKSKK